MKKIICLALLAGLFLFANSCHDEVTKEADNQLKSADLKKKEVVDGVKLWFQSNQSQNTFELLNWADDIKWSSAQVMQVDNSVVVEVQVKLKDKHKVMAEKDPSLNVDHRLLFIRENGVITSYMEYFISSKKDISYLQDTEKVNYSKKGKDFDGTIVLESPKKEIKVVSALNAVDQCGELRLKNASTICMCLVEEFLDGSIRIIRVLYCWDGGGDGGTGGTSGGDGTTPPTTLPCDCNICPYPGCGKCLDLLKSAPIDGEGGGTPTTAACEMCTGHPVPVVDATDLQSNPKADCIYQKLLNGGTLSNFISRYFGISQPNESFLGELNLTWKLDAISNNGITLPIGYTGNNSYYSVEIVLNETTMDSRSSTEVAMTMLHESLHAKLIAEYYDSVGSTDFHRLFAYYKGWGTGEINTNQQMEMLSLYAGDMATALKAFDQSRGINQPLSVYNEALKFQLSRDIYGTSKYPAGSSSYDLLKNSTKNCN